MDFQAILVGTLGFVMSGVLGAIVGYFGFWMFTWNSMDLDEIQEQKKNNHRVGIQLASVLLRDFRGGFPSCLGKCARARV